LILQKDNIIHCKFRDIVNFLRKDDILILNNTKVFKARIFATSDTGKKIEFLLLNKLTTPTELEALTRPAKKVKEDQIFLAKGNIKIKVLSKEGNKVKIKFLEKIQNIYELLEEIGEVPLPPYIKRQAQEIDKDRYQTVYAENIGSIAAPTAGLHFDKELIKNIELLGVKVHYLTLHIGLGSFKPINTENIENYSMPEEYYKIPDELVALLENSGHKGRIIAVGTSSVRALESYKTYRKKEGNSSLFIYPGYKFKLIDAMVTNFHQPKSCPFILTAAFCGLNRLKRAYQEAINANYRFLSYGDSMFILP
jgi:S-adenosylmethionine:tRNA ribosyltransferase-isomerase